MYLIHTAITHDGSGGSCTCVYIGGSYDAARTALASAVAGSNKTGWLIRNLEPSETIRDTPLLQNS